MHGSRQPVIVSRETKRPRFRLDARTAAARSKFPLLVQVIVSIVVRTGAVQAEHVIVIIAAFFHGIG